MKKHVHLEFGAYVQTNEEHSNDMRSRTLGAICLGPTGNAQGTHFFLNISTGKRTKRDFWTPLPMPATVIAAASSFGSRQGMPATLAFADRDGHKLLDEVDDVDDSHDPHIPSNDSDDETLDDLDYDEDSHSDTSDDYFDYLEDSDGDESTNEKIRQQWRCA